MMTAVARHSFEDHTGEVRLRLEAPTLAALFEEAAMGLAELMLEVASDTREEREQSVTVEARDREALLVAWLNELVFLSETRGRVYTEVRVHSVSDTRLEASVRGVFPEALRTAVKAATLHGLKVDESADGFTATVVLDV
jgi:SHS2 domain-containing protein